MGRRGPPPKPTALKVLQGNPGHQKLNKNEPKPKEARYAMPKDFGAEAKAEWRRIVPELQRLGLITKVDRMGLVIICELWQKYRDLMDFCNQKGTVIARHKTIKEKDANGKVTQKQVVDIVKKLPHYEQALETLKTLRQYQRAYGLTPADRVALSVETQAISQETEDELVGW